MQVEKELPEDYAERKQAALDKANADMKREHERSLKARHRAMTINRSEVAEIQGDDIKELSFQEFKKRWGRTTGKVYERAEMRRLYRQYKKARKRN